MRHLRIFSLLPAVLGTLGIVFLTSLSSCGGSETETAVRVAANITPVVVLTVENGGADGADLGGLNSGGAPATGGEDGWIIENWPVNLKAQVFMPADGQYDGGPIEGDAITHVGKVHFEYSDGLYENDELVWTAFKSNVEITGSGYATYNNFQGLDDGCPNLFMLRAHFTPTTQNGGPKRGDGSNIGAAGSDEYQQFTMGTIDSPLERAWIVVHEGRGDDPGEDVNPEEEFDLNINSAKPNWIPGTRSVDGEVFPVSFTLYVTLKGAHHSYTLNGKSHISDSDGEESEDNFSIDIDVEDCSVPVTQSITFNGTSPKGMGPLISHLVIGGSLWEVGDPHAATIPPPGQEPEPREEEPPQEDF